MLDVTTMKRIRVAEMEMASDDLIKTLRKKLKESNGKGNDRVKVQMAIDLAVGPVQFHSSGDQTEHFCRWVIDMVEMGYHGWSKPKK